MSATKAELEQRIEELEGENEELRDRLDQIAAISGTEEGEAEDDGVCDDEDYDSDDSIVCD